MCWLYRFLANLIATVCINGLVLDPRLNLLPKIFMLLNLNPVMSIIANVPAAIASSVSLDTQGFLAYG